MIRISRQFKYQAHGENDFTDSSGKLDGITLLRFAHIFKNTNAGGVEQYLNILNTKLLERNRIRIIQMYLVRENETSEINVQKYGNGELIWVPSILREIRKGETFSEDSIKSMVIRSVLNRPLGEKVLRFMGEAFPGNERVYRYGYSLVREKVHHDNLLDILNKCNIDLAAFHWISSDSEGIIKKCMEKSIPFVVVNHFNNSRLKIKLIRRQISKAAGFGGVSVINVPKYIKERFKKLSDGIDTEFFNVEQAHRLNLNFSEPTLFLPSRITPAKGHLDMVKAGIFLKKRGIPTKIVFAGGNDSTDFIHNLKSFIKRQDMVDNVLFIGELTLDRLRDWYATSDVVVLPTYSEGLGRVLLEAQAMSKPVVAYKVGGVPEAVVNGETGYIIPKGHVQELADKIQQLLKDDRKRNQMGESGRQFVVRKFNVTDLVKRHEEFYLEALSNCEKLDMGFDKRVSI